MDKKDVLSGAVKILSAKLISLENLIAAEDKRRKAAPSAMESWSDNIRFEKEVLISRLTEEKENIKKHIRFLKSLSLAKKRKIEQGSLVEIKNTETGEISFYFISLFAGLELKIGKAKEIIFISKNSPLTKLLLNETKGGELKTKVDSIAQKLKILSIL